jgi:hypothetical protein
MAQKELKKLLKEYLEINMSLWDYNTKMEVKETIFVFRLNSSLQHEEKRDFLNS